MLTPSSRFSHLIKTPLSSKCSIAIFLLILANNSITFFCGASILSGQLASGYSFPASNPWSTSIFNTTNATMPQKMFRGNHIPSVSVSSRTIAHLSDTDSSKMESGLHSNSEPWVRRPHQLSSTVAGSEVSHYKGSGIDLVELGQNRLHGQNVGLSKKPVSLFSSISKEDSNAIESSKTCECEWASCECFDWRLRRVNVVDKSTPPLQEKKFKRNQVRSMLTDGNLSLWTNQ
jgi:hypothetical protein